MKLTTARIERTLSQIDAQAVPNDHPALPKFISIFGDHTFFIDQNGLNIIEPDGASESGVATGRVINLASWSDEARSKLAPHERELTDTFVVLDKAA